MIPPETFFFKTCFIVGLNLSTKNNKYRQFTTNTVTIIYKHGPLIHLITPNYAIN